MVIVISTDSIRPRFPPVRSLVLPSGRLGGYCPCLRAGMRTGTANEVPQPTGGSLRIAACAPMEAAWDQSELRTACLILVTQGLGWGQTRGLLGVKERSGDCCLSGVDSSHQITSLKDNLPMCISSTSVALPSIPSSFWPWSYRRGGTARTKTQNPTSCELTCSSYQKF